MNRIVVVSFIVIATIALIPSRWFSSTEATAGPAASAQIAEERATASDLHPSISQPNAVTKSEALAPATASKVGDSTSANTMSAIMTRSSAEAYLGSWKLPPPLPHSEFNGKSWDLVDSKGRRLTDLPFDTIWDFQEGVALAKVGDQYARLDTDGKLVGGDLYQMVFPFSENLGAAQLGGKWGYIDYAGHWVIRPQYDYAWEFHDGLALVKYIQNGTERLAYIHRNGEVLGNQTFEMTYAFTEGLSASKINGKFGYIDRNGNWAIQPQFDEAWQFTDGKALVRLNGKLYDIDHHGSMTQHQ